MSAAESYPYTVFCMVKIKKRLYQALLRSSYHPSQELAMVWSIPVA